MIPMSRPLLPPASKLLPYLQKIDANRYYTNAGPLVCEYEEKIGALMGCHAAAISSGTAGLIAAFYLQQVRNIPAWTFVATANAIRSAGNIPQFFDVNEETWASETTSGTCPFGAPTHRDYYVTDAAAAFDIYATGQSKVKSTVVISTHATKCFSTAEGGLVLSHDEKFIQHVKEIINNGIALERGVDIFGFNGKLSEYHAAIGLAELDGWKEKRRQWLRLKYEYLEAFGEMAHTTPLSSLAWVGPNFCIRHKNADAVRAKLIDSGYMSRKVWGEGIHKYEAYKDCPRHELPVTEMLAREVVFLPYYLGIEKHHISRMAEICASL